MNTRTEATLVFLFIAGTALARTSPAARSEKGNGEPADPWLAVQVFLDNAGFRPGMIDGKWGEFTGKAFARYQRAQGKEAQALTGSEQPKADQLDLPLDPNQSPLTTYQITEEDVNAIGPVAKEPAEQASLKRLLYGSVEELVGEKFHAKVDLLKKLNPKVEWKAGETVQVPNVTAPFDLGAVEKLKTSGEKKKSKRDKVENDSAEMAIIIDTSEKMLDLVSADKVIASYPITPGSETLPAPQGEWTIEQITWLPPFRWDKEMLMKGKRGSNALNLPPGPNSPVGILWMQLNKEGIGIHGTDEPETIGRSASHGCIRLSNWDAFDLAQKVEKKTKVTIR